MTDVQFLETQVTASYIGEFWCNDDGLFHVPEQQLTAVDFGIQGFLHALLKNTSYGANILDRIVRKNVTQSAMWDGLLNYELINIQDKPLLASQVVRGETVLTVSLTGDGIVPYVRQPPLSASYSARREVFHPIVADAPYVFSARFYEGGAPISEIEQVVLDVINNVVKYDDVLSIYTQLLVARPLERFYFYPLLIWALLRLK